MISKAFEDTSKYTVFGDSLVPDNEDAEVVRFGRKFKFLAEYYNANY